MDISSRNAEALGPAVVNHLNQKEDELIRDAMVMLSPALGELRADLAALVGPMLVRAMHIGYSGGVAVMAALYAGGEEI